MKTKSEINKLIFYFKYEILNLTIIVILRKFSKDFNEMFFFLMTNNILSNYG